MFPASAAASAISHFEMRIFVDAKLYDLLFCFDVREKERRVGRSKKPKRREVASWVRREKSAFEVEMGKSMKEGGKEEEKTS